MKSVAVLCIVAIVCQFCIESSMAQAPAPGAPEAPAAPGVTTTTHKPTPPYTGPTTTGSSTTHKVAAHQPQ